MKCQVLVSLKNNNDKIRMSSATILLSAPRLTFSPLWVGDNTRKSLRYIAQTVSRY